MNEQLMDMLIKLTYGEQSRKADDIDLRIELWKQAGIAKIALLALGLPQANGKNRTQDSEVLAEQFFLSGYLLAKIPV